MDNANERQVGGSHYRAAIQHWDFVTSNEIPYLEAQIMRYLTRWRKKEGFHDLRKAQHYMQKLFEVEGLCWEPDLGQDACGETGMTGQEQAEEGDRWPDKAVGDSWQADSAAAARHFHRQAGGMEGGPLTGKAAPRPKTGRSRGR